MIIYDVAQKYLMALNDLMSIEDLPEQALADTLEGLSHDFEETAKNLAAFVKNLESEAEAVKKAKLEMSERQSRLEKRCATLKRYLRDAMQKTNIHKIKSSSQFEIILKKNPPRIEVLDESLVESMFFKVEMKLDKGLLKTAILSGKEIAGACLVQDNRVDIK